MAAIRIIVRHWPEAVRKYAMSWLIRMPSVIANWFSETNPPRSAGGTISPI